MAKTKVICISGKARHGKNECAEIIKEMLENSGNRVLIASYAGLIKYVCAEFFGWDGKKDENGRHILQYVGTDVVRKQRPDYWVSFLCDMFTMFDGEWDYILLPDTRFENEISCMKSMFDTYHLRVFRPNFDSNLTEEQKNHPSETSLDHVSPDFLVENSGSLDDLRYKLKKWLEGEYYGAGKEVGK